MNNSIFKYLSKRSILFGVLTVLLLIGSCKPAEKSEAQEPDAETAARMDSVNEVIISRYLRHYDSVNSNLTFPPEPVIHVDTIRCTWPDTAVNGMEIDNPASLEAVLGTDFKIGGDGVAVLSSKDGSQKLAMTCHPGSYYNQISEFMIGHDYHPRHPKGYVFAETDHSEFVTSRGIKLGMSFNEVQKRLGTCDWPVMDQTGTSTLCYRVELPNDFEDDYLHRRNMPVYFGNYHFEQGKLVHMYFGLEYP